MVIYSVVVSKLSDTAELATEVISSHRKREKAIKILAEERKKIMKAWKCDEIKDEEVPSGVCSDVPSPCDDGEEKDEDGRDYVIGLDIEGYFSIHDEDGMVQDEVFIAENKLSD